jgi:hypothetical protein
MTAVIGCGTDSQSINNCDAADVAIELHVRMNAGSVGMPFGAPRAYWPSRHR